MLTIIYKLYYLKSKTLIERNNCMYEKKNVNNFKSPDLSKLQAVVIDLRTIIYIAVGADPEAARTRYLTRFESKKL
jgi:hypothetical protein